MKREGARSKKRIMDRKEFNEMQTELAANTLSAKASQETCSDGSGIFKNSLKFDDDGRPRRRGTVWTASAHIIAAVIGSGVLSLAWAMAQLGWIVGIALLVAFALVTLYTASLLTDCYRSPDPVKGIRNYAYKDAVNVSLGKTYYWLCVAVQYTNLYGTGVSYTISSAISMQQLASTDCMQRRGSAHNCEASTTPFTITFGICQLLLSQIPNFNELWWLSAVAAVMSFSTSILVIGLSFTKVLAGHHHGTLTGVKVGNGVSAAGKIWEAFNALGCIAFAFSYSMLLIEIQDTLKSPPAENKTMKKASKIGVGVATFLYATCAVTGYLAFGNNSPANILTGFSNPSSLVDFGNMCIIVHLLGAYQIYCQPFFAFIEETCTRKWPESSLINTEYGINLFCCVKIRLNGFRLLWRSLFVVSTTLIAEMMPFFTYIVGFLGAVGFWPLTVFFPVEMYIRATKLPYFSSKWVMLQLLSFFCLLVTLAATAGSVQGICKNLKTYRPFLT